MYSGPPRGWVVAAKSDSVNQSVVMRGLYAPTAGSIKVTTLNNQAVTFAGVAAGTYVIGYFRRVWSTGTTVTGEILGGDDTIV